MTCSTFWASGTDRGIILCWADEEQFCKVLWANEKACGLVFDRPISLDVLQRTAEMVEEDGGPVANLDRIPLAQKRSRRLRLVGSD